MQVSILARSTRIHTALGRLEWRLGAGLSRWRNSADAAHKVPTRLTGILARTAASEALVISAHT